MKTRWVGGIIAVALGGLAWAEEINVIEAGPHHRVMQVFRQETDLSGETKLVEHRWQELATGLNRWDDATQTYVPAEVQWEPLDTGHVIARKTAHQLILSPEIGAEGAVELWGAEGLHLRSTVLGIGVMDAVTGTNYLLAGVREQAALELVSASEVRIEDAFDTWKAALGYRLRLDGVEQDLILQEQITPELLTELGIEPANARVFLMTEFFEPPQPAIQETVADTPSGQPLADAVLDFGGMQMGPGQVFADGAEAGLAPVRVGKEWKKLDGRQFLIETVPYADLAPMMERLPVPDQARLDSLKDRVHRTASLPKAKTNRQAKAPRFQQGRMVLGETKVAKVPSKSRGLAYARTPGVTMDYNILATSATLTIQGDVTSYVIGAVNVASSLIIEGGAVVKVTNSASASIVCSGTVVCPSDGFRMASFVSKDEDGLGEILPGSTGNPWTNYCGSAGLEIRSSGQNLRHLRFAHLLRGLFFYDTSAGNISNIVSHAQFVHCGTAIQANGYGTSLQNLYLRNALIYYATNAISGYSLAGRVEHLTAHRCEKLTWANTGTNSSLTLTNSLLVTVTTNGNMAVSQNCTSTMLYSNTVFQTVGGGGFYLASDNYRGNGTTNINANLAEELKPLTTYPPAFWTDNVTADAVWAPQAIRNQGLPDRGYHYPPLDYVVSGLAVTNATLIMTNGVVIGVSGEYGFELQSGTKFYSEGSPLCPNRLVRYQLVQEQGYNNWTNLAIPTLFRDAALAAVAPEARLRFTQLGVGANSGYCFRNGQILSRLALQDCRMFNGSFFFDISTNSPLLALTNSLFERVYLRLGTIYGGSVYSWNNLFRGSTLELIPPRTNDYIFRDNLFDATPCFVTGTITNNFNAYYNSSYLTYPTGSVGDRVLTNLIYQAGPLGPYYLGLTNLLNVGSRTATEAGLYYYTTQTNQNKEGTTQVDIGLHYPVLEQNLAFGRGNWTTQAGTYNNTAYSWLAVDGNTDPNYGDGSVCHTFSCPQAWWELDLGAVYSGSMTVRVGGWRGAWAVEVPHPLLLGV